MKKNSIFKVLLVMLLAVFFVAPTVVFADATITAARNVRTAGSDQGFTSTSAVAGARTGKVWEIDNRGAGSVFQYPQTIGNANGIDTLIRTGAARVTSITIGGDGSAAGDKVDFYDALTATGDVKIEVSIAVAQETVHVSIPGGLQFSTGIFADLSDGAALNVTVGYDF